MNEKVDWEKRYDTEVVNPVVVKINEFNQLPWYKKSIPHRIIARNLTNILEENKNKTNADSKKTTAYEINLYLQKKKIDNNSWFDKQNHFYTLKVAVSGKLVELDTREQSSTSSQLALYERTIDELKRSIDQLKNDNQALQLSNTEYTEEMTEIKNKILEEMLELRTLKKQAEKINSIEQKNKEQAEKINSIEQTNEELKTKLTEQDQKINSIEQKNARLKDELAKSEETVNKLSEILSRVKNVLSELLNILSPANLSSDLSTTITKRTKNGESKYNRFLGQEFNIQLEEYRDICTTGNIADMVKIEEDVIEITHNTHKGRRGQSATTTNLEEKAKAKAKATDTQELTKENNGNLSENTTLAFFKSNLKGISNIPDFLSKFAL